MSELDERLRSLIDTSAPPITLEEVYALEEINARPTTTSRRTRRARTRRPATAVLVMVCALTTVAVTGAVIATSDNTTRSQIAAGGKQRSGRTGAAAAGGCAGKAYVASGRDTVYVIDTATGTVSNRIRVGNNPNSVAITPDGKHLYVTGSRAAPVSKPDRVRKKARGLKFSARGPGFVRQAVGVVSVIDTATDKVSSRIQVPGWGGGVAINPDGKHAYLSYMGIDSGTASSINVTVIATATGKVSSHFADGTATGVFTPDGKHAYATNGGFDGTVLVIDTATGEVSSRITVGAGAAQAGAITPDGKHLYVASRERDSDIGTVSVIDTATGEASSRTHVGNNPSSVAITPDGKHAYVTSGGFDGTVYVIDTATGVVSALIPVGSLPDVVAITPDGTHAYVTSRFGGSISVIDTATGVVSAHIPVGTARDLMGGLAICPAPRP